MSDYTTPGTHTFTATAAGVYTITLWGAGGGGQGGVALGAAGHGGGGGAKVIHLVYLNLNQQLSLVLGNGGAGGAFGGSVGGVGADTTCTLVGPGTVIAVAKGGGGGGVSGAVGQGGQASASTGDAKTSGSNGLAQASGAPGAGGAGGGTGGGAGGTGAAVAGTAGSQPGGGGEGGGNTTGGTGGAGGLGKASVVAGQTAPTFPITAAGSYPYIVETTGTYYLDGYAGGGGGEGGVFASRGGSGGGGGAYAGRRYALTAGDKLVFTVGAGGAGGAYGDIDGSPGGDTTVTLNGTTILLAKGGSGGSGSGGPGGTAAASTGDDRYTGSPGVLPSGSTIYNGGTGGTGGGPAGGAGGVNASQNAGVAGSAPGGGGSGGGQQGTGVGGAGGAGRINLTTVSSTTLAGGRYEQACTMPGFTTWYAPDNGYALVGVYGGGGGGAHGTPGATGNGGGASGGYSEKLVKVTKGEALVAEVGAGGAVGAAGSASYFRRGATVLCSANGGPGATGTSGATGASTSGAVGDVKKPGQRGGNRFSVATFQGGYGAPAPFPKGVAGARSGDNTNGNAAPGTIPGGGGGGGSGWTGTDVAGAGAQGAVYISFLQTFGSEIINGQRQYLIRSSEIVSGVKREFKTGSIMLAGSKAPLVRLREDPEAQYRARPPWLPVGHERKFNRQFGTFNWKASNTANMRAGFAAAASGGSTSWLVPGDSLSEGWTSLSLLLVGAMDFTHSWPLVAMQNVATAIGAPVAGTGLVKPVTVNPYGDPRWTHDGNVTKATHYVTLGNGHVSTFTSDRPGTKIAVAYFNRPGDGGFTISVDNATSGPGFTTVTPSNAGGVARIELSGLANTTHSVKVTGIAGNTAKICGAEVFSPTGIRAHVVAQGGSTVIQDDPSQHAWATTSLGLGGLGPTFSDLGAYGATPSMVPILMGGNDISGTLVSSTELDSIEAALRNTVIPMFDVAGVDVVLIPVSHGSSQFGDAQNAGLLSQRFYELALDLDLPLVDMEFLTAGWEGLDSRNYVGDEYGHLSTAGAQHFGGLMAQAFLNTKFYTP